jgi:isopenicillin-N epimerase
MIPLQLDSLNCDYYTASCHKWLSAPFGSGFLFVHPRVQNTIQPAIISWGRPTENEPPKWQDEFQWGGTKDFASWLSIPSAIDFLKSSDLMRFRDYTHDLARYFRTHLEDYFESTSFIPDSNEWYGSMVAMPLPSGPYKHLQKTLWDKYQTEIPIIEWKNHTLIRISCHLYNDYKDIDHLLNALSELFPR